MSDAKKDAPAEGKEGEPKKKSKKMLFIIIGVVVLLVGAGVPTFMLMGGSEPTDASKEPLHLEPVLETWQLDPIVVNLSESTSFLKVSIVMEYDMNIINAAGSEQSGAGGGHGYGGGAAGGGGAPAGPPGAIGARMTQIKDAVIGKLSSKRAADVLSFSGKEALKEELVESINDAIGLDESPVVQVYFLEFIIQ